MSTSLLPPELTLIIRFTTTLPDLALLIPSPNLTSIILLKRLIRTHLPAPPSQHRYRLIHSGKLLRDGDILADVLNIHAPPPPLDVKGKGKARERERGDEEGEKEREKRRIYINCSIGDLLTDIELAEEEKLAEESIATIAKRTSSSSSSISPSNLDHPQQATSTTPAPTGFDRLLSGGFTPTEIHQLRLQFLTIQSSIHTADTMPSPETLRQMEDAWIDSNASGSAGGGEGGGGFDFGDNELGGGALDDVLWGNVIGFLWPLGCMGWAIREEGVWSKRRKLAICTGFFLSLSFGGLNILG